jgi:hypothetical protein
MSPELVMDMSLGTGDRDVTSGLVTSMSTGAPQSGNCLAVPPKHREVRFPVLPEKSSRRARSASTDAREIGNNLHNGRAQDCCATFPSLLRKRSTTHIPTEGRFSTATLTATADAAITT